MARDLKDGISRELRYMEYRLRKKHSSKSSEKKKAKNNQYQKSYPSMDDYSAQIPNEFKDALPSTAGEEDLQLQVALAVSREEAEAQKTAQTNDKIKLEMALKESAAVAAHVLAKTSPNHSNVDKNAPDPWGGTTVKSDEKTFDPFSFGAETSAGQSSKFGDDAWPVTVNNNVGMSSTSAQPSVNPWNATSQSTAVFLPPPQKNSPKQSDPWGTQTVKVAQPDPWAGTSQPSTSSIASAPSADPWAAQGLASLSDNPVTFSAAGSNGLSPTANTGFASSSTFDPLQEFDTLRISNAPSHLSNQAPSGVADLMSAGVLTPMPAASQSDATPTDLNDNELENGNHATQKAGAFLGENVSLVNVDNLVAKKSTSNFYQTLITDTSGQLGANRNPFNQKGPSPSLNQMKSSSQTSFPGQIPNAQLSSAPGLVNPTAMSLPPMGYSMTPGMPMQPAYGMPGAIGSNPFGQPAAPVSVYPQQNPPLF